MPPEQEGTGEVGLAGWWTTRIGILIGVIAVVFLGVYVNGFTSPAMRFLELLGISTGVFAAGTWLAKRYGTFGDVVSSGGLAMLYFTAFAAHGISAVQVTTNPGLGLLLQIGALGGMLAWSLRKQDAHLATLAIGLGYVSCAFAGNQAMPSVTGMGLLVLATLAGVLYARTGWQWPLGTALVGSQLGFLVMSVHFGPDVLHWLLLGPVALMATFTGALIWQGKIKDPFSERFAITQTSAAAVALLVGTWLADATQLEAAYLILGLAFLGHVVLSWRGVLSEKLYIPWFLKAATFIALYLATTFDGSARWLALIAQAASILWTMEGKQPNRRTWLRVPFIGVWITAYLFFARDAVSWGNAPFSLQSPDRWIAWVYLIAAMLLVTFMRDPKHRWLTVAKSLLVGTGIMLTLRSSIDDFVPVAAFIGWGIALLGMSVFRQSWLPLVAGAIAALGTHALLWQLTLTAEIWMPATVMAALLSVTSYFLAWRSCHFAQEHASTTSLVTIGWMTLTTTSFCILGTVAWKLLDPSGWLGFGLVTTTGLGALLATRAFVGLAESVRVVLAGFIGAVVGTSAVIWLSPMVVPWGLIGVVALTLGIVSLSKDHALAFIVMIPSLLATLCYLEPLNTPTWSRLEDLALGATLLGSLTVGAWWFLRSQSSRWWIDALMHTASMLVIVLGSGRHLDPDIHLVSMCTVTLLVALWARRLPFPTLNTVAWLPASLVLAWSAVTFTMSHSPYHWLGATILLAAWRMGTARVIGLTISALALLWVILIELDGTMRPLALSLISLAYAVSWRKIGEEGLPVVAMIGQAIAFMLALAFLTDLNVSGTRMDVLALVITAASMGIQGWILHRLEGGAPCWRDPLRTWLHGLGLLVLCMGMPLSTVFAFDALATVIWGVTSIILFIGGLVGGLRAYRMLGLLGLLCCLGRMFVVDVQDTFYRIVAFAVVAIVLLGIGFLYTRFRSQIEDREAKAT